MTNNKSLYLAGDILTKGSQLQRKVEAEELRTIGYELHVPHEDDEINDKANVDNDGLAEKIVKKDTKGIVESDIIVIDAHENGKGSLVELGQLAGMKDLSDKLLTKIDEFIELEIPYEKILNEITKDLINQHNKEVYVHNTDIRRANLAEQSGDRREYAPNQYVYGTALKLTNGKGFYEWHEIIEDLQNKNQGD